MAINSMGIYRESIGYYEDTSQLVILFIMLWMACSLLKRMQGRMNCPRESLGCFLGLFIYMMWCIKECICKISKLATTSGMLIYG